MMPSDSDLKNYYSLHSKFYDATRWTFLGGRSKVVNHIISEATDSMSLRVLEIGCGTGYLLKRLAEHFNKAQIIGLDLSEDMLNVAGQKLDSYENVQLLHQDFLTYKPDQPFDIIYTSYSMTMMYPILDKVLNQTKSILSEDGALYTVDFYNTPSKLFRKWMGLNHVAFNEKWVHQIENFFQIDKIVTQNMYLGLWKYARLKASLSPTIKT